MKNRDEHFLMNEALDTLQMMRRFTDYGNLDELESREWEIMQIQSLVEIFNDDIQKCKGILK